MPTKDTKIDPNSNGKSHTRKKQNLKEETDEENQTSRSKKLKLLDGTINILWNDGVKDIDNMDEDCWKADEEEALDLGYDLLWDDDDNANVVDNSEDDSSTNKEEGSEKTHQKEDDDSISNEVENPSHRI